VPAARSFNLRRAAGSLREMKAERNWHVATGCRCGSGMNNSPTSTDQPTRKQLRYLRQLASSRGQSFTPPTTRAEASTEIERLKSNRPQRRVERQMEVFAYGRGIADRWGGATAVRDDENEGYGSTARWRG
jgi:hypothetical protein